MKIGRTRSVHTALPLKPLSHYSNCRRCPTTVRVLLFDSSGGAAKAKELDRSPRIVSYGSKLGRSRFRIRLAPPQVVHFLHISENCSRSARVRDLPWLEVQT